MRLEQENEPAHRLRIALDLFDLGEKMLRQTLRRGRPEATEEEIDAAVVSWRLRRPGAELGDAPGHLRPWTPV